MNNMKTLNRILIGTVLLATLFSCQDVVMMVMMMA